jgi:hypothetical protein
MPPSATSNRAARKIEPLRDHLVISCKFCNVLASWPLRRKDQTRDLALDCTIPVAMLSLWSLLFASLMQPAEAVDGGLAGQAARA